VLLTCLDVLLTATPDGSAESSRRAADRHALLTFCSRRSPDGGRRPLFRRACFWPPFLAAVSPRLFLAAVFGRCFTAPVFGRRFWPLFHRACFWPPFSAAVSPRLFSAAVSPRPDARAHPPRPRCRTAIRRPI
jgi:hypothetical protein